MRTLHSAPYLTIYLHEGTWPALEMHWLGFASSTDFRAAAMQGLALGTQHHVKGWVGNDLLLGALRPRDLEWLEQAAMIPLAQMGLQRFALIESQDALNRLTINSMYERVKPSLTYEVRRFEDPAQARAWASGLN